MEDWKVVLGSLGCGQKGIKHRTVPVLLAVLQMLFSCVAWGVLN